MSRENFASFNSVKVLSVGMAITFVAFAFQNYFISSASNRSVIKLDFSNHLWPLQHLQALSHLANYDRRIWISRIGRLGIYYKYKHYSGFD